MKPICKDCAHAAKAGDYYCSKDIDVVTGDGTLCRMTRADNDKCGSEGKWFEKRFDPTDSATFTTKPAIETPKATIRQESDRPWEKPSDYIPE